MEEYSVLDIFSYVPKQKIDLEQLETIFVNEINNVNAATNGYYVEKYKQIHELEKNIKIAVEDLQNEGKKIAFIKKGRKIANYAQTECQFRYCGTAIPFLTVRSTAR